MKAIILVGGKATRLLPLSNTIPKALIDPDGRPIAEHILDLFKRHKIQDIIFSVGHLKDKIKHHFQKGDRHGFTVSYLEEDEPLGTAGPLNLLTEPMAETFIVCNGDELKDINISDMLTQHRKNKALATLALTRVVNPSEYGVAKMEGEKILEFIEKPKKDQAPSNLINAGLYILEPEVIEIIPQGKAMFEYDVFPVLAGKGKFFGYEFSGQWFDTGNFERLERARREWKGLDV